jgi:hypothetical protein
VKAALAIAGAEFRANRMALLAAIPYGLLGHLAVTRVDGLGLRGAHLSPSDAAMLGFIAITMCQLCMAAYMGAGAVSRDLSERRLGFYLARPIAPLAYWAPKLAVAFVVAYVFGWLIWVPGLLIGPPPGSLVLAAIVRERPVLAGAFATAFVAAAASAAACAVRSRSGLLPVDVVMLSLTGAAFMTAIGKSWGDGTSGVVLSHGLPWIVAAALLLVIGAGAAQIAVGRLDLRRGHAWLSGMLWTGLLACVGGLTVFSYAVADVAPSDLRLPRSSIYAPEAGTPVLLEGVSSRWGNAHSPAFFLDADGRFVRVGGLSWSTGFAWSADGRRFVWSSQALPIGGLGQSTSTKLLGAIPGFAPRVWTMRLDEPGAHARVLARRGPEFEGVRALSPSARRLLIANFSRRTKSVLDTDSAETIASIDDGAGWSNARFLSETAVRALRVDPWQARIVDWDVAGGRLSERGAIPVMGEHGAPARFVPTHDWERVLRFDGSGLFLHDLEGRLLATLVDGWPQSRNRLVGLLSDGRFGSVEETTDGLLLRVFDASGHPRSEGRFKGRFPVAVGGESAPGVLALGVLPLHEDGVRETLFVDLASGSVARREPGLWPALRPWRGHSGAEAVVPGSLATRLFLGEEGLVLLDTASGARKVLVQRRTP